MKKYLALGMFLLATPALGQQNTVTNWQTGTTSTGAPINAPVSATNPLPVTANIVPSGTQDVNLKQVGGVTTAVGTGASNTGTQRVTTSTDSTIGTVTSVTAVTTLGTVTNAVGIKGADGSTISSVSNPVPVEFATPATQLLSNCTSTAAEQGHVCKSGSGNIFTITVVIGATSGYLQIEDATAVPADGAVTPLFCQRVISDGTAGGASFEWAAGKFFTTGITPVFSTAAGCFSQTKANSSFFVTYK